MQVFFDSSSLAKRYLKEEGSEKVNEIFHQASSIVVSIICLPEIFSALNRLKRERKINGDQYDNIKRALAQDFKDFSVCDLTPAVIHKSISILELFDLRTMDALPIACALEMKAEIFVTADKKQMAAAHQSHLESKFI